MPFTAHEFENVKKIFNSPHPHVRKSLTGSSKPTCGFPQSQNSVASHFLSVLDFSLQSALPVLVLELNSGFGETCLVCYKIFPDEEANTENTFSRRVNFSYDVL